MYVSSLYVPSRVKRADPEKLSGLLLIVGNSWNGIRFFEFASLDPNKLEDVVKTFPEPLRKGGRQMIADSLRNAPQNGDPNLIYIVGYANNDKLFLNKKIKGADMYPLGIPYDVDAHSWHAFLGDSLEVALGYFLDYDPSLEQQKPL